MENRDIIVIGASAGGIETLKILLNGLPKTLPASIFIALHIGARGIGLLPKFFEQAGSLPASNAKDHERFHPGHIYVAPSDHHLLLGPGGVIRLTIGPKENRCRPAIDPLFRSFVYGSRVVGIVLTGNLDDGTAGLWAVRDRGGITVVQDPTEAIVRSMPESALRNVVVDHCVIVWEVMRLLPIIVASFPREKGMGPVPD